MHVNFKRLPILKNVIFNQILSVWSCATVGKLEKLGCYKHLELPNSQHELEKVHADSLGTY